MLKGLDLTLRKGTVTALVGHSGAGKSTVASLLSRFYEPQAGGIWLGGQPASAFSRGEWARAVALVSQEPVLFAGAPSAPELGLQPAPALARDAGHCSTCIGAHAFCWALLFA